VAIIGGGPSLVGFDYERLRGAHVLAVKGTIFDIPWADAGFGLDMPRFTEWRDRLAAVQCRVYWAVPEDQLQKTGPPPGRNITYLRRLAGEQVSSDPGAIYGGGTSGFGAMQVALFKRARHIVLFGFDYNGDNEVEYSSVNGFRHNDTHYLKRRAQNAENWRVWSEHFRAYVDVLGAIGVRVTNACPRSQITCFQKCTLNDGVNLVHGRW